MDRRLDRGSATRQQIIATATRLFAEQGYEAVSVDALLTACAISKGALYHHFRSKEAVFTAVLEAVEERVVATLVDASRDASGPAEALRAGAGAWLDLAASDATVRRIVLLDAPAAIGWAAWRAVEERYTLGLIRAALAATDRLAASAIESRAHLLLATLVEAALLIARDPDDAMRAAVTEAVDRIITVLAG